MSRKRKNDIGIEEDKLSTEVQENNHNEEAEEYKKKLAELQQKYDSDIRAIRIAYRDAISHHSKEVEELKNKISTSERNICIMLIKKMLPMIDNINMMHDNINSGSVDSIFGAVKILYSQFSNFLKDMKIKKIDLDLFNPDYHEALEVVETNEHKNGYIMGIIENGYTIENKVIRCAKVKVAKNNE